MSKHAWKIYDGLEGKVGASHLRKQVLVVHACMKVCGRVSVMLNFAAQKAKLICKALILIELKTITLSFLVLSEHSYKWRSQLDDNLC